MNNDDGYFVISVYNVENSSESVNVSVNNFESIRLLEYVSVSEIVSVNSLTAAFIFAIESDKFNVSENVLVADLKTLSDKFSVSEYDLFLEAGFKILSERVIVSVKFLINSTYKDIGTLAHRPH